MAGHTNEGKTVTMSIRLRPELRAEIVKRTAKTERTMSQEICYLLRLGVAAERAGMALTHLEEEW